MSVAQMKAVTYDANDAGTCSFLYSSQYILSYVTNSKHKFILHYCT